MPKVLATCDDEAVIGAPFYVMERIEGVVLNDELPEGLTGERIGAELIDALVEVHAADWQACGLEGYGKPTGYLERQVRRFTGLWEHNATREIAAIDEVTAWLGEHRPESGPATIVHGDYRLGNVMFTGDRLSAIFDWELATIGDPLADVGYLVATCAEPDDPPSTVASLTTVTRQPGFPTREDLVARYEERSGRSMSDLRWYTTLALWKSAVFLEGSYKRRLAGTTDDPFFDRLKDGVPEIAERARRTATELDRSRVHMDACWASPRRPDRWEPCSQFPSRMAGLGQGQGCSSLKERDRWRFAGRRTVSRRRRRGLGTGAAVNSSIRRTRMRWSLPRPSGPGTETMTRCACCSCSTRTTSSATCWRSSATSTTPRT